MCFSEVTLVVAVRHCAFTKVADDLDVFVAVEAKSRVGSDLVVLRTIRFPTGLLGRIAVRSYGEVMFCFEPACIEAADILE